jgi:molybdopterin-containing oxidoreductase family iron-sulfur binding subunit
MTISSRKTAGLGLDLAAIRARLAGANGPRSWRSLEELAETEEFRDFLEGEFPSRAGECADATSRRRFLSLMGASLALAGVGGCAGPVGETIVPYVRAPEEIVPGEPLRFATAVVLGGYATGVLVESHMGRPTMIEGNDRHPDSQGAIDPLVQASLLTLYDPDRSQVITRGGEIATWDAFLLEAVAALDAQRTRQGSGLRVLTETVTSPSLARLLGRLLAEFPEAKWHQYEPEGGDAARAGARLAFGEDVATQLHVDRADVVLALDADFLGCGPGHLRQARAFAERREPRSNPPGMNRLYAVESTPSITGAMADHRLAVRAHQVAGVAQAVAHRLAIPIAPAADPAQIQAHARWIDALARDLQDHRGASLVVAGNGQPPLVHALAHALNDALGNLGTTVVYTVAVEARPVDQVESLGALVRDIDAGQVDVLLILGGNPAFTAPADLAFADRLARVPLGVRLGLYDDETSALCRWHIPEAHDLEAWGDARASGGTVTIQQPLIAPLYGGRSAIELLAAVLKHPDHSGYEIVRATWRGAKSAEQFETDWRTALHDGVVAGTEASPKRVALKAGWAEALATQDRQDGGAGGLEVVFRPDPTIWDGRFANNGWLQELPKPLTKLTWDNAALIGPATAERLGLSTGDLVELRYRERALRAPVWILPGHADDSVTLHLGYGRTRAGRVGTGAGFNAYALRTSDNPGFGAGLVLSKTGERYPLASTQHHHALEGRDLVRQATLAQFLEHPDFARGRAEEPDPALSLYPQTHSEGYAWGLVVNLNACTGCGACVLGCQAENNIPIVGKPEVLRGREMHWLEVDRYYHGARLDHPEVFHQPRLCMHCENAPCEVVCPVAATVHDADGLNVMVYNRCVGTRYCSNNCPYKVRHFNFFAYSEPRAPSLKLLNNPDVTVRARGVMEKCTYCVQRINAARHAAEFEDRRIRDGEVVTACQAACPTRAIVFGDLNDPASRVARLRADPRNYSLLAELNTRPRTTYLAKLSNPNPELEGAG